MLQPFDVNRRKPRVASGTGFGAGVPGAITLRGGSVAAFSYSASNAITQSPGSGNINAAVYSPGAAPAFAMALTERPFAFARTTGCKRVSGSSDGTHAVNVKFSGFPATAKSGKS